MSNIRKTLITFARKIYCIITLAKDSHVHPSELKYNAQQASEIIFELIESNKPCMVCRYGATELTAILNYRAVNNPKISVLDVISGDSIENWWQDGIFERMEQWSGFFPSNEDTFKQFSDLMKDDASLVDVLASWRREERQIQNDLPANVKRIHLKDLEPFWCEHPWTRALKGKKVLVVHPFAELIKKQYKRRTHLFKNPNILPAFDLDVMPAVQSLGGKVSGFNSWFDALDCMKTEIDKRDYDICLIGCGAYGFPLAAHVKRQGKKAIHLGGVLQLLFGIRGNRWDNKNYAVEEWGMPIGAYSNLINEYWVRPDDNCRPMNANKVEGACYW